MYSMFRKMICLVSFVLVLNLVLPSRADADPNLVGWWKFDETSGTTASDSSGNGNDGILINPAGLEWVEGILGGALSFSPDSYVELSSHATELSTMSDYTVCFWVTGYNSEEGQCIMTWSDGTYTHRIQVELHEGKIAHGQQNAADWQGVYSGVQNWDSGEWYHVVFVKEGDFRKGYRDGIELLNTNSPPGVGPADLINPPNTVRIGALNTFQWFVGDLDNVHLYDRALTEAEINLLMTTGALTPELASNPSPANEATDVPRDVVLSWTPGEFAAQTNGHKVYLGDNFDDVNDVTGAIAQTAAGYAPPQRLDLGQTYYWRVDEVNAPPDYTTYKGDVWRFTVEPVAYPIAGELITATASSSNSAGEGPENTINGSGLDDDDLHSAGNTDMWLSSFLDPNAAWIQYEFDKVYKLDEMWVWNHNSFSETAIGFGVKEATIEYSVDGTKWAILGTTHEFARGLGAVGYAYNTFVDLGGVAAKYVKITANNNWGGILNQYGLSEVRFLYIPLRAREPKPESRATDVDVDLVLNWRAGREAAEHNLYISTDEQAVIDSNVPVSTVTETSHGPLSLDLGQTYYWKVNEVNIAEIPMMLEGEIWSFRTYEYFVVEDFEDYNDFEPDRIFDTWMDGWGVETNGAEVGYADPDFPGGEHHVETQIVHGGAQSMPFFYDNSTVAYSEATMNIADLPIGSDWTKNGVKTLSLWFKGIAGSFLEAPAGTFTMSASGADMWGAIDEFRYAFKQLSGDGEIVAKVESIENTNAWAKCGVMIRETLEFDSTHAFCCISAGRGKAFQNRKKTGQRSWNSSTSGFTAPYWVKLVRQGNSFTAYHSADGVNWEPQEESAETANPETIQMRQDVYIGLALTSHNANAVCIAQFSNVQITGAVSPTWSQQAIGADMPTIEANAPDRLYVALSNSGGLPAAVYHDYPNATQIGTWMEWTIDLQEFTGVNLTNVNTLAIGFGDKNNLQAGGSGLVLFDDIRLYRPEPEPAP